MGCLFLLILPYFLLVSYLFKMTILTHHQYRINQKIQFCLSVGANRVRPPPIINPPPICVRFLAFDRNLFRDYLAFDQHLAVRCLAFDQHFEYYL